MCSSDLVMTLQSAGALVSKMLLFIAFFALFATHSAGAQENIEPEFETLFDRDASTLWAGAERRTSLEVFYPGCFDQVTVRQTSNLLSNAAGVLIHTQTSYGWKLLHKKALHCDGQEQVFRLKEELCNANIRITLSSCSDSPVELLDLLFDSVEGREKRGYRGTVPTTCADNRDCADTFIVHVVCTKGPTPSPHLCAVPECVSNADCDSPYFAVCVTDDLMPDGTAKYDGVPACVQNCQSNSDCQHIPRYPHCVNKVCKADYCVEDVDCIDPALPVCKVDSVDGYKKCSAQCLSGDDCTHFLNYTECWVTPPCVGCALGTCNVPTCRENTDCTDPDASRCILGSTDPFNGINQCDSCTNHQHCAHLPGGMNWCDAGHCVKPDCFHDTECPTVEEPHCIRDASTPMGAKPVCGPCTNDDQCSHFVSESLCGLNGICTPPDCRENDECPMTAPICKNVSSSLGSAFTCVADCESNDDCAHFNYSSVACYEDSGKCIVADCFDNSDCTDSSTPVCDVNNGINQWTCVAQCSNDDDCTQFGPANYFDNGAEGPYYRCVHPFGSGGPSAGQCITADRKSVE